MPPEAAFFYPIGEFFGLDMDASCTIYRGFVAADIPHT